MTEQFKAIEGSLKQLLASLSTADQDYENAVRRAEAYATSFRNDPEFGVVDTRIGGSIGKGTAISPLSDVDLYVYLSAGHWQTRGGALQPGTVIGRLLARVEKRLGFEKANGHVTIRRQTHSVGIRFKRVGSVGIDVVPALVQGGDLTEAWIPRRRTSHYVQTSVERQIETINALDSRFKYLRRGIRLLKFWNRKCAALPSYAVEILGMHAVARGCTRTEMGVFLSTLDFMGRTNMREPIFVNQHFQHRPPLRRACVILDPAMPDNNVCSDLGASDGDRLGASARRTFVKLRKAVSFSVSGRTDLAAECLSEAFGHPGLFEETT